MFKKETLDTLQEEEVLKLYELFFGPILMRKELSAYIISLKSLLNREGSIDKVLEKLNTIELDILKLLSQLPRVPYPFLNEKLSIILGEHPSLIGKTVQNLISKNYLFLRNEEFLFVPEIISCRYATDKIIVQKSNSKKGSYDNNRFSHVINIISYFLSENTKFSKNGGLYKKDFDQLSSLYNTFTGYLRDEYDIVAYFFSTNFVYEENLLCKEIKSFFRQSQLERMLFLVKSVFPYLMPIIDKLYEEKSSYSIPRLEMKDLYNRLFLPTNLAFEPYRADFDSTLSFFEKIGLCEVDENFITFIYYADSQTSPMEMKITSNYSIYANSYNTDDDYYLCSLFGQIVRYDKIAEFEINDHTIKRAVRNGYDFEQFENFTQRHNIELGLNVSTTIKEWFEKYSSFFYLEGIVFIAESTEKGRVISKLIETKTLKAYPIKKDAIFLVPPEEKEPFFSFLEKSNISFHEKKPKKEPIQKLIAGFSKADICSCITFQP